MCAAALRARHHPTQYIYIKSHLKRHGQQNKWPHSVTMGSLASSRHMLHSNWSQTLEPPSRSLEVQVPASHRVKSGASAIASQRAVPHPPTPAMRFNDRLKAFWHLSIDHCYRNTDAGPRSDVRPMERSMLLLVVGRVTVLRACGICRGAEQSPPVVQWALWRALPCDLLIRFQAHSVAHPRGSVHGCERL